MMKQLSWHLPTPSGLPRLRHVLGLVIVLAAMLLTARTAEINPGKLVQAFTKSLSFLSNFLVAPDRDYFSQLLSKMLETLEMTFLATMLAMLVSLPLGLLAARNASPHPVVYRLTRDLLSLIRALPELVWALIFVSAVGLGPLPGIMALCFVTVGFMGKFFAESLEVIDSKAVEGVAAHGAGWFQIRIFAMLPQAYPDFVGTLLYILDHNLRMATILGLVGAGGIGFDMVEGMRMFQYDRLMMIAIAIYLVVTCLDWLSASLRKRII